MSDALGFVEVRRFVSSRCERNGIEGLAAGIDSQLGSEGEVLALGMREAGESPLAPRTAEPGAAPDTPHD